MNLDYEAYNALKRYERKGPNWGLIAGCLFSLMVWAGVILLCVHAVQLKDAAQEFLQKVGLGG